TLSLSCLISRNHVGRSLQSSVRKSIHTPGQKRYCDLLRQIRHEAGLTQVQLAEMLGTPHSRVSDYERGERRMDLLQLRDYLKPLGVSLSEFVQRFEGLDSAMVQPS